MEDAGAWILCAPDSLVTTHVLTTHNPTDELEILRHLRGHTQVNMSRGLACDANAGDV